MGRLIDADEVKKKYPQMENKFGMIINEGLHKAIDSMPTVEAIPKADYENRLKADMLAMLTEIDLEMSEQSFGIQTEPWEVVEDLRKEIIQQKINSLKEAEE